MSVKRPLNVWLEYDRMFWEHTSFPEADKNTWLYEDSIILGAVLRPLPPIVSANPTEIFDKPYWYTCGDPNHYFLACPHPRSPSRFIRAVTPAVEKPGLASAIRSQRAQQPFPRACIEVCRDNNAKNALILAIPSNPRLQCVPPAQAHLLTM